MKPSIKAILWNDWPALACWLGVLILWGIYIVFPFLHRGSAIPSGMVLLPICSTAILSALLAWRILRVVVLFTEGVETVGQIVGVFILKDRGRLIYVYNWKGKNFKSWCPVHKTKRVIAFSIGQSVRVFLNPDNPKNSIVAELFQSAG
ncbi:MAG: hypothetical protein ACU836_14905 [Gammaproteobacteria bacterium]